MTSCPAADRSNDSIYDRKAAPILLDIKTLKGQIHSPISLSSVRAEKLAIPAIKKSLKNNRIDTQNSID